MRPPAATTLLPALLAALLAAGPPPAAAAEITLESRTYLPVAEDGADNVHATGYEYLDLGVDDAGLPGLSLRAGGWGRVDLADETHGRSTNGDLQYGYLSYLAPRHNAEARLGRIAVTAGAARNEVLDGLQLGIDLVGGIETLAYGGVPVELDEGGRSGDTIWGGRVAHRSPHAVELGLSYLREENDGEVAREEAALDAWVRPGLPFAISGVSLYNVDTSAFARHDWRLLTDPLGGVRLGARYSWTGYEDFFTSPGVTAFSAPFLDPEERLQSYGADLEVPLGRGLTAKADYTAYRYEIASAADRYGGRLSWSRGTVGAGLAYHRADHSASDHAYDEYTGDVSFHLGPAQLALGAQELRHEEPINGTRDSLTVFAAADAALSPALSLGADVEYQSSPTYDSRVRGLLKLTWRYAHETRAADGGASR